MNTIASGWAVLRVRLFAVILVALGTWHFPAQAQLRIGWQSADVNAFLTYAIQTKMFEQRGITPVMKPFAGGPALLPAFAASEIDIGFMGDVPATTGFANGLPIAIFSVLETYPRNVRLIAAPGVQSLQDLRGKKIGITTGSVSHYHALLALRSAGLGQQDATLVNLGQASMPPAFRAQQIDAAIAWEPSAGELEKAGGRTIATTASLKTLVSYVAVGRREYLRDHPREVQVFLEIWEEVARRFEAAPAEVAKYEAGRTGKSTEEVLEVLARQGATRPPYRDQLTAAYFGKPPGETGRLIAHLGDVGKFLFDLERIKALPTDVRALADTGPITTYLERKR